MDGMGGMTTQFGLINSLRTGNVVLDMMVCMVVPLLFGGIGKMFGDLVPMLTRLRLHFKSRNKVERVILHTKRMNNWGYSFGASTSDHILQKVPPGRQPLPPTSSADRPGYNRRRSCSTCPSMARAHIKRPT